MLKATDTKTADARYKAFETSCKAVSSRVALEPKTTSTLEPTEERSGAKPDLDRAGAAMRGLTHDTFGSRVEPRYISPEDDD